MKSFISILALVAVAAAADVAELRSNSERGAQIVVQEADVFPDQYQYRYETSNGIQAEERGALQNVGREDEGIAAQGGFAYTGPDGNRYAVTYTADQGGFVAQGAHLPTAWPVPEYIAKAIAYNLANSKPDQYSQKL